MKQPHHNACSLAEATVTVNSLPTDRHGPWWRHAFEVDNDTSAAYTQAVITAVQSNLYSSVTGHVFVAETQDDLPTITIWNHSLSGHSETCECRRGLRHAGWCRDR